MQHLVQIIQFAGEGSQDCKSGPQYWASRARKPAFLPSFQQYHGLKKEFIMIPLAGRREIKLIIDLFAGY